MEASYSKSWAKKKSNKKISRRIIEVSIFLMLEMLENYMIFFYNTAKINNPISYLYDSLIKKRRTFVYIS